MRIDHPTVVVRGDDVREKFTDGRPGWELALRIPPRRRPGLQRADEAEVIAPTELTATARMANTANKASKTFLVIIFSYR